MSIYTIIYTYKTWILCVCVCVCPHFSQPPKVPASRNFCFKCLLGQLKTWQNPFFLFFINTDSRGICRVFFMYTNLYHYQFCSGFSQSSKAIASWNVVPRPTLDQLKREWNLILEIVLFTVFRGIFCVFFKNKSQNHVVVNDFLSHQTS